jgi:energy-coupling factor transport system permease protein
MDPRTRLIIVANVGLLAVVLDHPASLFLLAALTSLPFFLRPQHLKTAAMIAVAVVWSTVLAQGLFYSAEPRVAWLHLGPLTLWREGVQYGLVQSLRVVAVGLAGVALSISTPPDRLYAALLKLRLPFGLALMAGTALRFVPEIGDSWRVVRRARARRGRPAHHRTPWAWLQLEISLLRPLVARALRRAWTLGESLDTRGFDPVAPRATRRPLQFGRWEPTAIVAMTSISLSAACARVVYLLYSSDSVYWPILRPVYSFVRNWL